MKRSARLIAKQSQYSTSVTLYREEGGESSSERSPPAKRVKRESAEPDSDYMNKRSKKGKQVVKEEIKLEDVEEFLSGGKGKQRAAPNASTKKKSKAIKQTLATPHPTPDRWQEQYDLIKRMRNGIVAPVDTMGCDRAQLKETDPKNQRFATLVSLMLSSQTKDEVTDAAVTKLRQALGGSLTVDGLRNADDAVISQAIDKVGFWRRKTAYLKQTAQRLYEDFESDVPKTVEDLCSLPGVGPKMSFLVLQVAWKLNLGIGVDVHVHRITNRLKWHKPPTKNPEETRVNLESWLPIELHPEINHTLVGFGQTICLPVGPRCDLCDLNSQEKLCPSAQKVTNAKNRKALVLGEAPDSGPRVLIAIEDDIPPP